MAQSLVRSSGLNRDIKELETQICKLKTINAKPNRNTRVRNRVANRFGKLSTHVRTIDKGLKVAIASTIAVTDGRCYDLSYNQLLSAMKRNPALKINRNVIKRSDSYNPTSFSFSWQSEDEEEIK